MNKSLYIVPSGGLANRMRAIACGIYLADKLGFKPEIIWRRNWEIGAAYSDLFAESPTTRLVRDAGFLRYNLIYEIPRKKNLYISALTHKIMFDKALFDEKGLLLIADEPEELVNLIGDSRKVMIRSGLEFYLFDPTYYRQTFRPSPEVADILSRITDSFNDTTYGFHIRRTDNVNSIKYSPVELFVAKADELLSDPDARIFLASDSEDVKQLFHNKFHGRIITSPVAADRSSRHGMLWGFAELLALSKTKRLFGSYYSSFSEAAALLGDVPYEQVKIRP